MIFIGRILVAVGVLFAVLFAFGNVSRFFHYAVFELGDEPTVSIQTGPRGTGLVQPWNPRTMNELEEANMLPASVPFPGDEGYRAGDVYENLQVLGDVSTGQFTRLMVNITEWVSPEDGCAGCHNVDNFAEDSLYTKVVARRMLEMVRHINTNWTDHVVETGVTCYTCHRGQLVPSYVWFNDPGPKQASGFPQMMAGQNHPAAAVGQTSLPRDPLTAYLEGDTDIRVQPDVPRPNGTGVSIKQAEHTHGLMIHMSEALGVNCDYCHNTRAFSEWSQSSGQRQTAWYGIRMVRDLNNNYLNPLKTEFPANRLGPALGDAPKVSCATCHNGVFKPLFGQPMAQAFPSLKVATAGAAQAPSPALVEEVPWQ